MYIHMNRGEVVEIDTWVGASGKNGMRRDWQLRSQATGLVFARATRYYNVIYSDFIFNFVFHMIYVHYTLDS